MKAQEVTVLTTITIRRYNDADGTDVIDVEADDIMGEVPSLIELYGMLELAKETCRLLVRGEDDT